MSSGARMMGPVFQQIGSAMERLTVLMAQMRSHAVSLLSLGTWLLTFYRPVLWPRAIPMPEWKMHSVTLEV